MPKRGKRGRTSKNSNITENVANAAVGSVLSGVSSVGKVGMDVVDKAESMVGIEKRSFSGFDDMCIVTPEQRAQRSNIRKMFPGDGPMIKGYPDQPNWGSILCFCIILFQFIVWCFTTYATITLLTNNSKEEDESLLYTDSSLIISWVIDTFVCFFYIYYMYNMCNICRGVLGYVIIGIATTIYGVIRVKFFNNIKHNILSEKAIIQYNEIKNSRNQRFGNLY